MAVLRQLRVRTFTSSWKFDVGTTNGLDRPEDNDNDRTRFGFGQNTSYVDDIENE
jgi:hypothetical protein